MGTVNDAGTERKVNRKFTRVSRILIGFVMIIGYNNESGASALKANTQQVLVTPPRVLDQSLKWSE